MSGLAIVARGLGAEVTGSDVKATIYTESLLRSGITAAVGHHAGNVPAGADQVVYSSAVPAANCERQEARRRGVSELHRSDLLAEITRLRDTVAVAGAHGKSTTSALLAHVLRGCGLDPSYVVGALLRPPGAHAVAGSGGALVIEADESDRSLLRYHVKTAVVTNVDLDHVGDGGGYRSVADVAAVLGEFSSRAGAVVASAQAAPYLRPYVEHLEVVEPEPVDHAPTWFRLDGQDYEVTQPGEHQLRNAALAVRVARRMGCGAEEIRAALRSFPGLVRRFEPRGRTAAGARVFDDYAHHPTEVAAVLRAARQIAPSGRILAVFQPHLFSRTQAFAAEFAEALTGADAAWVEPVYPAREDPARWTHVSSQQVVDAAPSTVRLAADRAELAARLRAEAGADDVIVLIGAGDVGALADQLVT